MGIIYWFSILLDQQAHVYVTILMLTHQRYTGGQQGHVYATILMLTHRRYTRGQQVYVYVTILMLTHQFKKIENANFISIRKRFYEYGFFITLIINYEKAYSFSSDYVWYFTFKLVDQ